MRDNVVLILSSLLLLAALVLLVGVLPTVAFVVGGFTWLAVNVVWEVLKAHRNVEEEQQNAPYLPPR